MLRRQMVTGFRTLGALGAVALTLSACGGGGGGGIVPGGGVIVNCASLAGGGVGYSLGTCNTLTTDGTVLESQLQPINAAVTIAPDASSYNLNLGATLGSHSFSNPADETNINTLGKIKGIYLQKDYGGGAYAALGDFADARDRATNASVWGAAGGLTYTSFGLWERFISASEGYYGGWYVPRTLADAAVSMPVLGSANYIGIAVGAMAPTLGFPPSYGVSASLSLTASFSNNSVTGLMSDFQLSNVALPGGLPVAWNIGNVTLTGLIAGSGFTGTMAGGAAGGKFEGAFFGPATGAIGAPAEVGGRFEFVTPDARQVVGAFGGRQ